MADKAELLVNHYRDTFEHTYRLWIQRNRLFLILVAVIGAATVLTYQAETAVPLLAAWIANAVGISDDTGRQALAHSFPYALLQSLLLILVFFLMFNLYHRALYVLRSYSYLGRLEAEIRAELAIEDGTVAFTRESRFYWSGRPPLLGTVKWVYVVLLGVLLGAFLGGRIYYDFQNPWLLPVDIAATIPIGLYFVGYAKSTVRFDKAEVVPGTRKAVDDQPG